MINAKKQGKLVGLMNKVVITRSSIFCSILFSPIFLLFFSAEFSLPARPNPNQNPPVQPTAKPTKKLASPAPPSEEKSAPAFSPSKTYDLASILDLALSNNPTTRSAWLQARAASASIGEARAAYYPKLLASLEAGADKWYTPAANAPDNFRRKQATVLLSVEYLLLDFGRRSASVEKMMALFESSDFLYRRILQQVAFETQAAYFAHEAALSAHSAALSQLDAANTALLTIEKEVRAGLSATPELLKAKKNLFEAESAVAESLSETRNALGKLCTAAGLPANTPLKLSRSTSPPSSKSLRSNVDRLIEVALADRPDLAAKASTVRAQQAEIKRSIADFFPTVKLEGNYANSGFQYTAAAGKTGGTYQENLNGYGGFLVAEWEIFDGFERLEHLKKNRALADSAKENLAAARLSATRDVWQAFNDNASAAARLEFAESYVASTKENYEAVKSAFACGLASVSEFSDSAWQLSHAEAIRASALAQYSTALAALTLAIGSGSPSAP